MLNQKDITSTLATLKSFKGVTSAYSQIASIRMKKIRLEVLEDREYINSITEVFDEVRRSFAYEIKMLSRTKHKRDNTKITMLSHNGRNVLVLLASKAGLYGEIVDKTYRKFVSDVQKNLGEVTLVGRQALLRFQADFPHTPYTFYDVPDHAIKESEIKKIMSHIVPYERITVYYGKFVSLIEQLPEVLQISSTIEIEDKEGTHKSLYIFEPDLEKILKFFELEIFISLFGQTIRESELAKQASRAYAMEKAGNEIKKRIKEVESLRLIYKHRTLAKAQLNSLNGIVHAF